ncbi:MAG: hypothetical protein LBV67_02735 [Streptococcaceae bacterium]|nr:hypothetical protein [Streptococcaceae bacterium]
MENELNYEFLRKMLAMDKKRDQLLETLSVLTKKYSNQRYQNLTEDFTFVQVPVEIWSLWYEHGEGVLSLKGLEREIKLAIFDYKNYEKLERAEVKLYVLEHEFEKAFSKLESAIQTNRL